MTINSLKYFGVKKKPETCSGFGQELMTRIELVTSALPTGKNALAIFS